MRPLLTSLAAVLSVLALAGCGGTIVDTDPPPSPAATENTVVPRGMPEGKGSGQPDGIFPRTVAHFGGETEIGSAPQRVVVISTGQADAALTLGVVPVGSTSGEGADTVPQYLIDNFPEQAEALGRVQNVGSRTEPSVEAIAALEPDLILFNAAGDESVTERLAAIAPTVLTQGGGTYWKQDFLLLADALGRVDQAQAWLDSYHQEAASFGDGVDPKPTMSLLRQSTERLRIYGSASFPGSVVADAGLPRPESQQFTDDISADISAEELARADADWLLYAEQGKASPATELPLWNSLTAVRNGHAVELDDDSLFSNTGPTAARLILDDLRETLG